MPTYEYGCSACGQEWEEVQRITEPPTEVCPKCSKPTAHRLISAGTNFILKGGGWYSDLYSSAKGGGNKASANGGSSSDSTASSTPSTTETKAETKPAAPAAPTTPSSGSSSS